MASRLPWPNWTAALLALENASVAGFRLVCVRPWARAMVSSVAWWAASNPFAAIPEVVGFASTRLIHADKWLASNSSLKRENFAVVAKDESKQPTDRLRRRRFTQRVTHVPRQVIEFLRC